MSLYYRDITLGSSDEEERMQFSLIYRGPLPACQDNDRQTVKKQEIRLALSHQLRLHWETEPVLAQALEGHVAQALLKDRKLKMVGLHGQYGQCMVRAFNFKIFPLACRYNGLVCHLDIDLFRRAEPGSILNHADIDNQLKTLFDALRMPLSDKELPGHMWGTEKGADCLFVLLEDDSLITRLTVDTQRLATPKDANEPDTYAEATIKVSIRKQRPHSGTAFGY